MTSALKGQTSLLDGRPGQVRSAGLPFLRTLASAPSLEQSVADMTLFV